MTPAEMMEAADSGVVRRIAPFLDQAIIALYHGHQERVDEEHPGRDRGGALGGWCPQSVGAPPAICFLDITGYTRLTEERGDEPLPSSRERCPGSCNALRLLMVAGPSSGWATG
jgi:hypothetical protein